jgi:hypothetical protein
VCNTLRVPGETLFSPAKLHDHLGFRNALVTAHWLDLLYSNLAPLLIRSDHLYLWLGGLALP